MARSHYIPRECGGIPASDPDKSSSRRDRPCRETVTDQRRFPVRAKAGQNAFANLRQSVGGIRTILRNPDWGSAIPADSESDCWWRLNSDDQIGGESPIQSSGHVRRTSRLRQKSSAMLTTLRHKWQRTRACDRSWIDRPGSDAAASVLGNAALRS